MRRVRPASILLIAVALAILAATLFWPAAALTERLVRDGVAPRDGWAPSARQLGLVWRGAWMAVSAAIVAALIALPAAAWLGSGRRRSPGLMAALTAVLLCPPMVFAFGWEKVAPPALSARTAIRGTTSPGAPGNTVNQAPTSTMPGGANLNAARRRNELRCMGIWTCWAWPIPALLIGAGWARTGRRAYEAALLDTDAARSLLHVALPQLFPHIALSVLLLFVLFFADYAVPHATGVPVIAVELLAWAEASPRVIDTLWPAAWTIAITAVALGFVGFAWSRLETQSESGEAVTVDSGRRGPIAAIILTLLVFGVTWIVPLIALARALTTTSALGEAWMVYGEDLVANLGTAAMAGLLVIFLGVGVQLIPRLARVTLWWSVLYAALPGALIGIAMISAWNRPVIGWVYDHWPIVSLAYTARFGWIGVLVGGLVAGTMRGPLAEQARVDGAREFDIWLRIVLPLHAPILAAAGTCVIALSMAEIAASSLVRVPHFNPIAHVIFEKFHRMEDDMLISLSFWLVGLTLPAALLVGLLARRRAEA